MEIFGMQIEFMAVVEVFKYVVMIALGGLSLYYKSSTVAQEKTAMIAEYTGDILAHILAYITEAEGAFESGTGEAKKAYVVDKLYDLVPESLQGIITKELIEPLVQSTFDETIAFAQAGLDKLVEKIEVPTAE